MRLQLVLPLLLVFAILTPARALSLQGEAERALGNRRGTVVLMRLDGRLLALVHPRLAEKAFVPGSIAKLVTAASALEAGFGVDHPETCRGTACWRIHGRLGLTEALARSCSQYFYQLGRNLNPQIARSALDAGFGRQTGFAREEAHGSIDPHARLACGENGWQSTPLQWAVFAGAIANGGTRYRPHWAGNPRILGKLPWSPRTLAVLREGMSLAAEGGSARKASSGLSVAGKTGTTKQPNGWFVGFAPREKPKVALCVFVEGGTGYEDASPIAHQVFQAYLKEQP